MATKRICFAIITLWFIAVEYVSSDCPAVKKLKYGRIRYQNSSDKSLEVYPKNYVLQFRCFRGYSLKGAKHIVCLSPNWTRTAPVCKKRKCADTPVIPNALYSLNTVVNGSLARGSTAVYTCDDKYEMENKMASTLTCDLNPEYKELSWIGELPRCLKQKQCDDPEVSPDGNRTGDCCWPGDVVSYSCREDYELVGETTLECLSSGNWTSRRPYCRPSEDYCEHPPPIAHGVAVGWEKKGDYYRLYDEVEIICKPGYVYSNWIAFLDCEEGGWNNEFAGCEEVLCHPPEPLANGTIPEIMSQNITEYPYNFDITYICDEGYRLIGDTWRFCEEKGWSGGTPHCEVIQCPDPGLPECGSRTGESFGIGDKVSFKCFTGFQLLGSYERFCQPNGQWSGDLASCNAKYNYCPDPGIPVNGRKNSSNYDLGARIRFQCHEGFNLWGSRVRECLLDKTWSGKEAICKGAYDFDNTVAISEILKDQISVKIALQEEELKKYYNSMNEYYTKDLRPIYLLNRLVLYFIFDVSRSIGEANFRKSVELAKVLVRRVGISPIGARAGAVTFSSHATVQFLPAQYKTTVEVLDALDKLVYTGGGTSATDVLQLVREDCIYNTYGQLKDKSQTSVIFLMTNGNVNMGGDPVKVAEVLKEDANVEIYCIAVTRKFLNDILHEIASEQKEEHLFILQNFAAIDYISQNIANGSIDYSECGLGLERLKRLSRRRIIEDVRSPEPWPWMAAIYFRPSNSSDPDELKCGGSIIHEKYILTASHCLFVEGARRNASDIIVKLGLTDVQNLLYGQTFEVKTLFVHSQYTKSSKIDDYDIALLELSRPIEFNAFVRPICLPSEVLPLDSPLYQGGEYAVATGWVHNGVVRKLEINTELRVMDHLKEEIMDIQPKESCTKNAIANTFEHAFTDRMFCAYDGHGGNNTCKGVSGGPLMQAEQNPQGLIYWTQIGIVSGGIGCGLPDTYSYYTNVQSLRSWVTETIEEASMAVEEE